MRRPRRSNPAPEREALSRQPLSPAVNPRVNVQTRKVLSKHYRAKHGVK